MTSYPEFWKWFAKREADFFDFARDQERILDDIEMELQEVDPDLTFDFGRRGKRENV